MGAYSPLKVTGMATGLVQSRENFLLPDDAYPTLQNAYVWRERIKRKKGYQFLGRLQRSVAISTTLVDGSINLLTALEPTASIAPGTISLMGGTDGTLYTDTLRNGTLTATGGTGTGGTINYVTGVITITAGAGETLVGTIGYYPGLPVMGIRTRELQNSANDETIFFDQVYAYIYNASTSSFMEWIPGTKWSAHGGNVAATDFFWSTNYWIGAPLISIDSVPPAYKTAFTTTNKLFWVTNNTGQFGQNADPPRITDGVTWMDFYHDTSPTINSPWAQIDATNWLVNWLAMLPYRGRMVTFNTWEGTSAASAQNFSNRIRWDTIGNPFIPYYAGTPATGSWRDDIRGQGGFLDIPTSEDIISIGFVRDNLIIYCERSTWQLRYTGRTIAPFNIERVNSELGVESTFSAVQFDTSLVGIGDKGVVECDSYKSERIDIKIPDFVFQFNSLNNGVARIQGIRDFTNRLAYWTIPLVQFYPNIGNTNWIFPTARLVYNYENDSWAIFNDSLTTLGNFQLQNSPNWIQIKIPWIEYEKTWLDDDAEDNLIVGGNQQGFIEILDQLTVNDISLYISNIVNNGTGIAQITSPNHNMQSGFVIGISQIPVGTPFSNLNGGIYGINVLDNNNFTLLTYNIDSDDFDVPVVGSPTGTYLGIGYINIRENFYITSKKFNFLDEGQSIQIGYLDILMVAVNNGALSLKMYIDYDDETPSNTLYNNTVIGSQPIVPDTFFNSIIPTYPSDLAVAQQGTKFWQRVYCPTRANFFTIEYTFSNSQMASTQQQLEIQIDAQILWIRRAGRLTQC